jgi:hypothetical protein
LHYCNHFFLQGGKGILGILFYTVLRFQPKLILADDLFTLSFYLLAILGKYLLCLTLSIATGSLLPKIPKSLLNSKLGYEIDSWCYVLIPKGLSRLMLCSSFKNHKIVTGAAA